ncbi:hypothetical protein C1645_738622 [Glomus cerebriforme]|uniref:Uncharacterized protein n=1 Tax=Glomus cerebriforme TaxID=658196 RepID=A0A397SUV3_9GLOM|nr:hypothetical protein C1645_738622 [Glomus cerebriforme]
MIERLEKRWNQWEQPLLLLSFMLHPKYQFTYFNTRINNLSYTIFGRYLTYYYKAWFQKRPRRLLLDFEDYHHKVVLFDDETFNQFGDDVFKFWRYIEGDYKELAKKKELRQNKIEFLDTNSGPVKSDYSNLQITDDNTTEGLQQNPINVDVELDNEIIGNESDIITSERWERELNIWKEMLAEEERSRLEEEEALRNDSSDRLEDSRLIDLEVSNSLKDIIEDYDLDD